MRAIKRTPSERLWSRVVKTDECWLWTGTITTSGYGQLSRGRHAEGYVAAHRLAWELTHGPVPTGLWVLHHCDVRNCVRPDHLFLGTTTDNMRDMAQKGRQRGHPPFKTHILSREYLVREYFQRGRSSVDIAREHGLSSRAVRDRMDAFGLKRDIGFIQRTRLARRKAASN